MLNERISNLVNEVDELSISSSKKEVVEVQLENIRQELQREILLSTKDIEIRVNSIEKEVDDWAKDEK